MVALSKIRRKIDAAAGSACPIGQSVNADNSQHDARGNAAVSSGDPAGGHPLAVRDHALFATLVYTGIRLSDVVRLRESDLDLGGGACRPG
jgi:integrase